MLGYAEQRIRALVAAHSAAELNFRNANARIEELENSESKSKACIAFLEGELAESEQRAQRSEKQVEETIRSIQSAISSERIALSPVPTSVLEAAA